MLLLGSLSLELNKMFNSGRRGERKTILGAVLYQICLDIFDFARPVSYDTAPGILSESLHQQGRTWSERTKSEKKIASHPAYKTKQNKKKIYISFASDREKEDQEFLNLK